MKMKLAAVLATFALVVFIAVPTWAAEDGGALFKAKCAGCHGADAAGKGKAVSLKGADEAKVKGGLAKAPHTAMAKNLSEDQVKAIATHLKGLK